MERGLEAGTGDRSAPGDGAIDLPVSGVRGKEPLRRAVRPPVIAQEREGRRRERDVAVVLSLPGHMDEPAGAVDLGHLEARPFQQAQAAGVDGDQTDPVDRETDERENAADLVPTQHDRQAMGLGRAHQRQRRERLAEGTFDEELDAAQGDGDGGAGVAPFLRELKKVRAEFVVGDEVRRLVEMLGELTDRGEIRLLGPG